MNDQKRAILSINSLSTLKEIRDNFVQEIKSALESQPSSLSNLQTTIPEPLLSNNDKVFQVISIGGSIIKSAEISYKDKEIKIIREIEDQIPLLNSEEIFLNLINKYLNPSIKIIGLNLAYPIKPVYRNNVLDGVLLHGTKEHNFQNLINKKVGQTIEQYIFKLSGEKITVTVANDSVCLILSGLNNYSWKNLVAGIVGTGTNLCIFKDKNTVVNLESGNFNKFPVIETNSIIDNQSITKNQHLFEKEVAGAYLYKHFNYIVKKNNIPVAPINNTLELNYLAENETPGSDIAKNLLEHSASLTACQIAGIYKFKKQTKLNLIMEGNLFWKGWHYQKIVRKYLKILIDNYQEQFINFIHIKSSNLIGASQLVIGIK